MLCGVSAVSPLHIHPFPGRRPPPECPSPPLRFFLHLPLLSWRQLLLCRVTVSPAVVPLASLSHWPIIGRPEAGACVLVGISYPSPDLTPPPTSVF